MYFNFCSWSCIGSFILQGKCSAPFLRDVREDWTCQKFKLIFFLQLVTTWIGQAYFKYVNLCIFCLFYALDFTNCTVPCTHKGLSQSRKCCLCLYNISVLQCSAVDAQSERSWRSSSPPVGVLKSFAARDWFGFSASFEIFESNPVFFIFVVSGNFPITSDWWMFGRASLSSSSSSLRWKEEKRIFLK